MKKATGPARTQVASEFEALGFTDYETRTYIALLKKNPATAYEISKTANIPRANTYAVLEGLTRKKAILPVSEKPARYVPVSPDLLFQQIAEDTQARCRFLKDELSRVDTSDSTDIVWNLEGEAKIDNKIFEMIREATDHIWIKAHKSVIDRFVPELREACRRDVSLLIILFGADHNPFDIEGDITVLPHEGNGIRMGNADNFLTITTDFTTALMASITGQAFAAYTQSRPIVTTAESLIRHDLYMAEMFTKFGDQIEREFGPLLYKLRAKYFSPEQMLVFSQTIAEVSGALLDLESAHKKKPRRRSGSA